MLSSIHSLSERWWLPVLLLALWGLTPLPASGAQLTDEAKAQARVKYNEGNDAYERGDFRKALASFDAAYQLAPLPGFLFNVAQCHRQLGAFERAAFFFRRYLTLSEREPANAAMVRGLIEEMDFKAKQEAASRTARAKPVMQAKAAEKDRPEAIPAKAPDSRRERSGLKDAERRALDIRTSRSLSAAPKSLPPGAVPGAPEPEQQPRESLARKWWVWAGAGAAVLLTGGIVYAVTTSDPRPTTLGSFPAR